MDGGICTSEEVLAVCRQRVALMGKMFNAGTLLTLVIRSPSGDVEESSVITNDPDADAVRDVIDYHEGRGW